MLYRRTFEISCFVVIATSLHVAAAAVLQYGGSPPGIPDLPPGPGTGFSVGSAGLQEIVDGWDAAPEIQASAEPLQPEVPEISGDEVPEATTLPQPQSFSGDLIPPTAPAAPQLPDPQRASAPKISIKPALALTSSEAPVRRPAKAATRPKRQAQSAQTSSEPAHKKAVPSQSTGSQPARTSGERGSSVASGGGGGGSGGSGRGILGPSQKALADQWTQQISACLIRRMRNPPSLRKDARLKLSIAIARSGTIQGVSIIDTSGDSYLDQIAVRAAKRVRRCPAAPNGLQEPRIIVTLPVNLVRR